MRIDAHVHVWTEGSTTHDVRGGAGVLDRHDTVERLRPLAAAAGVHAVVAVQTVGTEAETERLLALAHVERLIAGVVGWVDLGAADVAARLDRLRAGPGGHRLVGIRAMLPVGGDAVPGAVSVEGMRALADRGLALDLLLTPDGLAAALAVADAMPELSVVVDHLAKPIIDAGELRNWERGIRALAERENVAVKLSGLLTRLSPGRGIDALLPYVSVVLEAFGVRRVMIGSDWPLCEPAGGYEQAIGAMERLVADIEPGDVALVSGGTVNQWYRLALGDAGRAA